MRPARRADGAGALVERPALRASPIGRAAISRADRESLGMGAGRASPKVVELLSRDRRLRAGGRGAPFLRRSPRRAFWRAAETRQVGLPTPDGPTRWFRGFARLALAAGVEH